jgi:hypothetical protein
MILKIVLYLITVVLLPFSLPLIGWLFFAFSKIFISEKEKMRLNSFQDKWEGKYVFLLTLIPFFIYLFINELWENFIGHSIPYLLILILLILVWTQYKKVKKKDLEGFVNGYYNSQNSDLWVGVKDIMKEVPGMEEFNKGFNLSKKQIEDRYIPTDPLVYFYKGIIYSLILLFIYLSVYSRFPSSLY